MHAGGQAVPKFQPGPYTLLQLPMSVSSADIQALPRLSCTMRGESLPLAEPRPNLPTWKGLDASPCPNFSFYQMHKHSAPSPVILWPRGPASAHSQPPLQKSRLRHHRLQEAAGDSRAGRGPLLSSLSELLGISVESDAPGDSSSAFSFPVRAFGG